MRSLLWLPHLLVVRTMWFGSPDGQTALDSFPLLAPFLFFILFAGNLMNTCLGITNRTLIEFSLWQGLGEGWP